jgi:cytochrome b pre-mRNA-processing protein 3
MAALFRQRPPDPADAIHARILQQARLPAFYENYGVADTLDGRFEMVVLHAFLFFHRLKGEDEAAREIGQRVFDILFRDFDRNLREMGMSYIVVPKRVKAMGRAFYGRTEAYDAALADGGAGALEAALAKNVYGGAGAAEGAARLARYVRAAAAALAAAPAGTVLAAGPDFPDPAAVD